jgi:type IV pilus assembly protein PilV
LIEVLVSIVVASLALLALAGVQAASLRYTKMSQYRAVSTQLANDLAERMRANRGYVARVNSGTTVPGGGFLGGSYRLEATFADQAETPALPAQTCTLATGCDAAELAALDLAQWRIAVRDQLPQGSAFVVPHTAVPAADVWVVWLDPAVSSSDEAPASANECPSGLQREANLGIRCSYFRINL